MSSHTEKHAPPAWDGEPSPMGTGWRKMMMWWFLVGDGILFAGFLSAYGYSRLSMDAWPDRTAVFHLGFIAAMTFVLISSSATMAIAVEAARRGDNALVKRFLLFTAIGGAVFLGMQAVEWSMLIRAGAKLTSNPWGPGLFTTYFFVITGFHGTHVLSGVVLLLIAALRAGKGKSTPEGIEVAGLYWHFVDLVWVFIFGGFYLI